MDNKTLQRAKDLQVDIQVFKNQRESFQNMLGDDNYEISSDSYNMEVSKDKHSEYLGVIKNILKSKIAGINNDIENLEREFKEL